MMRALAWILVAALGAACACKQGGGGEPAGPGTGSGTGTGTGTGAPATCDALGAQITALYEGAAGAKPTPEEVADNTAMVLAECRRAPDRLAPCVARAATVAALEACLPALDDEGSEGLQFQDK